MHSFIRRSAVATAALFAAACGQSTRLVLPQLPTANATRLAPPLSDRVRQSCPGPAPVGFARCVALVRTDEASPDALGITPMGYGPTDLQAAYRLPSRTAGAGRVVAIVDAYDDAHAQADLAVYRAHFGLPACTANNGCFRKVNQGGGLGSYPPSDEGWAQEISLDLDMVSAICPNCRILLVEANSATYGDLAAGVDTAARLGAKSISNSYGGAEFPGELNTEAHYRHPGIMITASSGDSGYGAQFPAASRYVTAVGGTTLQRSAGVRGWSETAWSGAGSGCSAFVAKPRWQNDVGCARRTIADVAAVADPWTGVAAFDRGWLVFGGTSVAAPIIASVYALAGDGASLQYAQKPYRSSAALFDITGGSNGSCRGNYLCTSVPGFDGPTGNGTPDGIGAF